MDSAAYGQPTTNQQDFLRLPSFLGRLEKSPHCDRAIIAKLKFFSMFWRPLPNQLNSSLSKEHRLFFKGGCSLPFLARALESLHVIRKAFYLQLGSIWMRIRSKVTPCRAIRLNGPFTLCVKTESTPGWRLMP